MVDDVDQSLVVTLEPLITCSTFCKNNLVYCFFSRESTSRIVNVCPSCVCPSVTKTKTPQDFVRNRIQKKFHAIYAVSHPTLQHRIWLCSVSYGWTNVTRVHVDIMKYSWFWFYILSVYYTVLLNQTPIWHQHPH